MNNEQLLQLTKHLAVHGDLNSLNDGVFESAYKLDGLQILPPLMTEIKRLEMQQLRLQALAIEVALKRNKPLLVEKQLKCLMPRMVNASTNTVLPVQDLIPAPTPIPTPTPMIVMGRFRQKLQKSDTAVYDHTDNRLTTLTPPKALPISMATHLVVEDAPQRAVVKIMPIVLGTMKSTWVSKLGSCRPMQRCTTSIELREVHRQERVPGRPVVFPSSTQISKAFPNTAQGRFRSQIPTRVHRTAVSPKVQAPLASVIAPGHASCHEPNAVKTDSANERRRNYGAKVAMKRNEMAKKREEQAKLKPPPRTNNSQVPKSIRTPIRRMEAGEGQGPFLIVRQEHEQQQDNQVPKSIRTPIMRVEGAALLEPQMLQSMISRQEESVKTNNNIQVIKSIRTPIRRMEAGSEDSEQQSLQIQELPRTSNNQVPKSIRAPVRRMEAGSEVPDLQQLRNRFQSLAPRQEPEQQRLQSQELPRTSNNQAPKSIRTPIRRGETGESQESEQLQLKNRIQSLISRQEHEQQQGSARTNNTQVPKSIRTPVRRVEGAELLDPELLQQKNRLQLLIARQEIEQQRLQAELEQEQQGLIDQMVGNIATSDSQDTTSELVADPEPHPIGVTDPHQA